MDFKEATDRLTASDHLTLAQIGEAFGVQLNTISRARMEGENARRPPASWRPTLARLAQEQAERLSRRAANLRQLARELEAEGVTGDPA